jgi:hypothetical protein
LSLSVAVYPELAEGPHSSSEGTLFIRKSDGVNLSLSKDGGTCFARLNLTASATSFAQVSHLLPASLNGATGGHFRKRNRRR